MGLSADITSFTGKAKGNMDRVHRGAAMQLCSAIIQDTPVDTGRLRAAWVCTIGRPSIGFGLGKSLDPSGSETTFATIDTLKDAKATDQVFFQNNLPYAERIEYDGWSHTKAPDGMVRKNVVRFEQIVKELAAQVEPDQSP